MLVLTGGSHGFSVLLSILSGGSMIHPVPVIGYLWCQCSKRLHGCILQVLQHSTASKTCKTRAFIGGTWWNCKILQVWGLRFLATFTHKDFIKVLWWCESQSSGIRVVSNDHPWSPSGQGCTDDGRCRLEGLVLLRDLTIAWLQEDVVSKQTCRISTCIGLKVHEARWLDSDSCSRIVL